MGFINYLINGISLGSVYAIIALGYTMVYGIAKMLNFAHGDVIMIGSYVVFVTVSTMGLPPMAGVLLAVAVCTLLGMTIERIAYKPLRGALTPCGSHYGNRRQLPAAERCPSYLWSRYQILHLRGDPACHQTGGRRDDHYRGDHCHHPFLYRYHDWTHCLYQQVQGRTGHAGGFRGQGAATLMGINVNGTIALTFAIGSALAAIAGVLLCSAYPSLNNLILVPCRVSRPLLRLYSEESDPFRVLSSAVSCWVSLRFCPRHTYPHRCQMPLCFPS